MEKYKELTGVSERTVRKLYFISKNGNILVNELSKKITLLEHGKYISTDLTLTNDIFNELVNKRVLVETSSGEYSYFTISKDYRTYLKNRLKLSESQKSLIENYLSYKNKGLDTFISHYRFGNREHDYDYTLARMEGDNLKLVNTFPFEYKKRTVNSLYRKRILVSVTNKGRIVNDIEATHLLYDKTDEKVIGLKYLNEEGDLI